MSNLPDLDALLNESDNDSDLVRTLRSAIKTLKQENKQNAEALSSLRKENRTRTLADVLKDKGVSEKAAKLFPADTEPTAEAVDEWLGEYGDLFGIEVKPQTSATQEQVAAAQRISAATAGAPPAAGALDIDGLLAAIASASTQAELDSAYARAGLTQPGD